MYNKEDETFHVGGNLHEYVGVQKTKELIDYADKIYLKYGADTKLEGIEYKDEVAQISKKAKKEGIDLISIPIRHLGTEKAHKIYKDLQDYLEENKIDMLFETIVDDLIIENNEIKGVKIKPSKEVENEEANTEMILAEKVVIAVGRKGANWLVDMCNKHNIKAKSGIVDIGIRYELPDSIMKDINKYMYEGKFVGRVGPYRDKVRTFCQNPSGFVSSEVYDKNLALVNGHSYKEKHKYKFSNISIT